MQTGLGMRNGSPTYKSARLLVDTEDDDGIGVLVLGQQKAPGRIDREIAGVLAQGWLVSGGGQLARTRINLEDGDAVMAPVRSEYKLA